MLVEILKQIVTLLRCFFQVDWPSFVEWPWNWPWHTNFFAGCNYVLHSTGQLYSHKRKHERHDFELSAFKELKSAEPMLQKSSKFKRSVMDVPGEKSLSKEDQEFVDLEDLVRISQLKPSDDDAKWAGSNDSGSQLAADETDESCDEEEDWDGNAGKSSRPDVVPSSYMDQRSAPTSPLPLLIANINDVPLGESLNLLKFRPGVEKRTESPSSSSSSADVIPPVSSSSSSSPASTSLCLPKHPPAVNGKKERDESWKKYLTRSGFVVVIYRGWIVVIYRGWIVVIYRGWIVVIYRGWIVVIYRGWIVVIYRGWIVVIYRGWIVVIYRGWIVVIYRGWILNTLLVVMWLSENQIPLELIPTFPKACLWKIYPRVYCKQSDIKIHPWVLVLVVIVLI